MCKDLQAENIPCTLILDSAVAYVMEQVDFVVVGAEGVVESGGIVNKVRSITFAIKLTVGTRELFFIPGWKLHDGSLCS